MNQEQDNLEFKVSQYLDGQLSTEAAAELEELLGRDLNLRKELQQYASLNEMLQSLAMPAELEEIDFAAQRQDIMATLERRALVRAKPRWQLGIFVRGALAAAAVLVLALSAFIVFRGGEVSEGAPIVAQSAMERLEPAGIVDSVMVEAQRGDEPVVISQIARQPKATVAQVERLMIDLEPSQASTVVTFGGTKPQRQGGGMEMMWIE